MAHWFALLQSGDAWLNLAWLLLAVAALSWWARSLRAPRPARALLALALILVVVFPVISAADDIAELALVCDGSPSALSAVLPAVLGTFPGPSLPQFTGFGVSTPPVEPRPLLLSSATGIHSPPLV